MLAVIRQPVSGINLRTEAEHIARIRHQATTG
jgi:hypothetical protein